MNKKVVSGIVLALLLIGTWTFSIQRVEAEPTTITVPDDYPTIQEAVNGASSGDTILVHEGLYAEGEITVCKRLSLIAEGTVVVDGLDGRDVFSVGSDGVVIDGFTVKNGSRHGIAQFFYDDCRIEGNIVTDNRIGISISGNNNIVKGNLVSNNGYGILVEGSMCCGIRSSFNVVEKNIIVDNGGPGIGLIWYADNNIVEKNIARNNSLSGISFLHSDYNVVRGNIVTGSDYGIAMAFSEYNVIGENTFANNLEDGIFLVASDYNVVKENTVDRNTHYGIALRWSRGNSIKENFVKQNEYGIASIGWSSACSTIEENMALSNKEFDLYWDGKGTGNVWIENRYQTKSDNIMQEEP